jgi:hypothetical protein
MFAVIIVILIIAMALFIYDKYHYNTFSMPMKYSLTNLSKKIQNNPACSIKNRKQIVELLNLFIIKTCQSTKKENMLLCLSQIDKEIGSFENVSKEFIAINLSLVNLMKILASSNCKLDSKNSKLLRSKLYELVSLVCNY